MGGGGGTFAAQLRPVLPNGVPARGNFLLRRRAPASAPRGTRAAATAAAATIPAVVVVVDILGKSVVVTFTITVVVVVVVAVGGARVPTSSGRRGERITRAFVSSAIFAIAAGMTIDIHRTSTGTPTHTPASFVVTAGTARPTTPISRTEAAPSAAHNPLRLRLLLRLCATRPPPSTSTAIVHGIVRVIGAATCQSDGRRALSAVHRSGMTLALFLRRRSRGGRKRLVRWKAHEDRPRALGSG